MYLDHPDTVTIFRRHLSFFPYKHRFQFSRVHSRKICISFWFAAVTNCPKLSGIKQHRHTSDKSGGQEGDTDLSGVASGCPQAHAPLWWLQGRAAVLAIAAPRRCPNSLAHNFLSPPSKPTMLHPSGPFPLGSPPLTLLSSPSSTFKDSCDYFGAAHVIQELF